MTTRANFAVLVDFALRDGALEKFLGLVRENAAQSVAREPECFRFDVLTPGIRPDTVLLYEIYADRAAFDVHLHSEHFLSFDAATRDLVARKEVTVCSVRENSKP